MENFVLKAKSTIKRVAAISAGVLMMGATVFGAAAAADYTLADYPTPFVADGQWVGLIVVGADAASEDVAGAIGVAATLAQVASPGATAATSAMTGGETADIILGEYLGNTSTGGFDDQLEDDDIAGLVDSSLDFAQTNYDYHDEIAFESNGPRVVTSLVSSDDDYEEGIFLETARKRMKYKLVFDENINITTADSDDPLEVEFLGRKLTITSATATQITARVGLETFVNVGDSAVVEGKTVKLINVGSTGSVIVDVDGTTETVSGTETVNGIEIDVTDYFYADELAERSATLTIGIDAVESYDDGDKYVVPCAAEWHTADCTKDDPDWIWEIGDLGTNTPSINVTNDFVVNDDDDNPVGPGQKYDYPTGGYAIEFEKLTVADDNYATFEIEFDNSLDLSDAYGSAASGVAGFILSINTDEGIFLANCSQKASKVYLHINSSLTANDCLDVLYKDPSNNQITECAVINLTSGTEGAPNRNLGYIIYDDTKSSNIQIDVNGNSSQAVADSINLTLDIRDDNSYLTDGEDDIDINLGHPGTATTDAFNGLGPTASTEEAQEITWGASNTKLGTKDENHRTKYGIVIDNPDSNGAGDSAKFLIPGDDVRAVINIVGPETTITTSGGAAAVSLGGVPVAKLDTEVTDKTAYHMILVGGPAVNKLTAEAMGLSYPTYGAASGVPEGKGLLKLVGDAFTTGKVAMVVAGWNADNTRDASEVLQDYQSYTLSGAAMEVTSTAGVISVGPATVTPAATDETGTTE